MERIRDFSKTALIYDFISGMPKYLYTFIDYLTGTMWMDASILQTRMKDIMRAGALTNVMLAQDKKRYNDYVLWIHIQDFDLYDY